jgi:heptosyltransferase-3
MLEGNPDIARVIEAPSGGGTLSVLRFALRDKLWRAYDLALITQNSGRAHLLGWLAAKVRSGLVDGSFKRAWVRAACVHTVTPSGDTGDKHVVADNLDLLRPWVAQVTLNASSSVVAPQGGVFPIPLARWMTRSVVVVHVPSMWLYKAWPIESFCSLVAGLLRSNAKVVLTGSGSDSDRNAVNSVVDATESEDVWDASGQLSFAQVAELLRRARQCRTVWLRKAGRPGRHATRSHASGPPP